MFKKVRSGFFQNIINRLFDSFGIYIRRKSLPRGTSLKHDISKLLSGESPKLIFDVGAHKGETALNFTNSFPNAIIHSFEPIKENYNALSKITSSQRQLNSHQIALGAKPCYANMCIRQASVLNSLEPTLNKPEPNDRGVEKVRVETIDRLLKNWDVENLDLLKIDVEGYESKVIEGCQSSLKAGKVNLIYLETGLDDRFIPLQIFINQLAPFSMKPYAFYDQTSHWTGKQSLWYWNALFVKDFLL